MPLHPAENRGYRELYAFARRMADHWSALAARLPPSPASSALADGARSVERMIEELEPLTATHGLHGQPAAQGLGASLGVGRSFVRDRFLERNQAVRYAVADAALVRALLGYLAAVSAASGNADLAGFSARWEGELGTLDAAARAASAELGSDPDGAIEPVDASPIGRAAHGVGQVAGTAGEWFDRQAAKRH